MFKHWTEDDEDEEWPIKTATVEERRVQQLEQDAIDDKAIFNGVIDKLTQSNKSLRKEARHRKDRHKAEIETLRGLLAEFWECDDKRCECVNTKGHVLRGYVCLSCRTKAALGVASLGDD